MSAPLRIVSISDNPAETGRLLSSPLLASNEDHPQFGRYGRLYYPAVHGAAVTDLTFVVAAGEQPLLAVPCTILAGEIGMSGLPMRFIAADDATPDAVAAAVKAAFRHIDGLAETTGARTVWLREKPQPMLSSASLAALGRNARSQVALVGSVDLSLGEAGWKRALRKSFQQFVNWGRRSFTMSYVNSATFSTEAFDRFREFHIKVAGRVTRPQESWDAMRDYVAGGGGELQMAELDGQLAAASLFIDGRKTSIYMTGVYDRDLDKPLAHYMVWHGIERAAERGMERLELGDIHQRGAVDDKLYDIGYFKRGFTTDIETWIDWRWSPKTDSASPSA